MFVFRIYGTFSCETVLPPSKISSSCRSDHLHINSFCNNNSVTTDIVNQTSTIHSVDTGLIYAVVKLSFSKQYKIQCFNPLCHAVVLLTGGKGAILPLGKLNVKTGTLLLTLWYLVFFRLFFLRFSGYSRFLSWYRHPRHAEIHYHFLTFFLSFG